jgi:hypothetical protein
MRRLSDRVIAPKNKKIGYWLSYLRLLSFWSDYPKKRFVILTQSRTGGSLLLGLLGSHPQIHCDGEIFNASGYQKVPSCKLYLTARSRITMLNKKDCYGFKLKYHHLVDHQGLSDADASAFMKMLCEEGWKVIYLRRNNVLRRVLSGYIAKKRALRHVKKEDRETLKKVKVECETLLNDLHDGERRSAIDEGIVKDIPHLLVEYETDLLDAERHPKTCARIFEYLELAGALVSSGLGKTSTDDLSESIENYQELETILRNTKYYSALLSHGN